MTSKLRYSSSPPLEWLLDATFNNHSGHERNHFYAQAEHILTGYVFGVLLFTGLSGNVVSFVVLQNEKFSHTSMRFLLSALSFVDTGLLIFGLLRQWLWELLEKDPRSFSDVICKIWYFGVYFFGQLSPWTIVLLTSERFISICWPMRAKRLLSTSRVVIVWTMVAAVLFVFNAHSFFKVDVQVVENDTICMHSDKWHFFHMEIWLWSDFVLVCALPFLLIASFNVATIVLLTRVRHRRSSILRGGSTKKNARDHISATVMLIVVSVFFLVTTSPLELFFLISDLKNTDYNDFMYALCNFLYYLNSSANFCLYCLSGSVFRKALGATFATRRRTSVPEVGEHRKSWSQPPGVRRNSRLDFCSYRSVVCISNSTRQSLLLETSEVKTRELIRMETV